MGARRAGVLHLRSGRHIIADTVHQAADDMRRCCPVLEELAFGPVSGLRACGAAVGVADAPAQRRRLHVSSHSPGGRERAVSRRHRHQLDLALSCDRHGVGLGALVLRGHPHLNGGVTDRQRYGVAGGAAAESGEGCAADARLHGCGRVGGCRREAHMGDAVGHGCCIGGGVAGETRGQRQRVGKAGAVCARLCGQGAQARRGRDGHVLGVDSETGRGRVLGVGAGGGVGHGCCARGLAAQRDGLWGLPVGGREGERRRRDRGCAGAAGCRHGDGCGRFGIEHDRVVGGSGVLHADGPAADRHPGSVVVSDGHPCVCDREPVHRGCEHERLVAAVDGVVDDAHVR